jgi:hypothetical protein
MDKPGRRQFLDLGQVQRQRGNPSAACVVGRFCAGLKISFIGPRYHAETAMSFAGGYGAALARHRGDAHDERNSGRQL